MHEWFSVKEKMPEDNTRVFVWENGSLHDSYYMNKIFFLLNAGIRLRDVTHWMPLPYPPEPPK